MTTTIERKLSETYSLLMLLLLLLRAVAVVVVVEAFRCRCCKFALVLKLIVCLGLLISTL